MANNNHDQKQTGPVTVTAQIRNGSYTANDTLGNTVSHSKIGAYGISCDNTMMDIVKDKAPELVATLRQHLAPLLPERSTKATPANADPISRIFADTRDIVAKDFILYPEFGQPGPLAAICKNGKESGALVKF
jgi:hypothetical protein